MVENYKKRRNNEESRTQLSIIRYCKLKGYAIGKTKTHGVRDKNIYRFDRYVFLGFPDLTAFTPELVFIEVKSSVGKMSEAQQDFKELCEKAGIKYVLARSVEDVEKAGL